MMYFQRAGFLTPPESQMDGGVKKLQVSCGLPAALSAPEQMKLQVIRT